MIKNEFFIGQEVFYFDSNKCKIDSSVIIKIEKSNIEGKLFYMLDSSLITLYNDAVFATYDECKQHVINSL